LVGNGNLLDDVKIHGPHDIYSNVIALSRRHQTMYTSRPIIGRMKFPIPCIQYHARLGFMSLHGELQIDRDGSFPFQQTKYHKHLMMSFQRHVGNTMREWLCIQNTLNCELYVGYNIG
jgi:hypothetical protein